MTLAGYRVASLSGSGIAGCSAFSTCTSSASASLAFEVDATCAVRVYVLGNAACSDKDNLVVVEG